MFGFIIDKDHLDGMYDGRAFWFNFPAIGAEKFAPEYTIPFKAYDDDNELYYVCRAAGCDGDDDLLYRIFEFLQNDSGVTYLIVDYPHAKDVHFP